MENTMPDQQRVAIITGGGRGLGKAMATAFAEDVTSGAFPDEDHSYR